MSVNKYKPHVWVVPEDDATRQLANGFNLSPALDETRIDIRPAAGGWPKVLKNFEEQLQASLRKYPGRHLVLLVDFDDDFENRIGHFRKHFPEEVSDRVYVLGVRSEPEPLRTDTGMPLEEIGIALANECANGLPDLWNHRLLKHNESERMRLAASVMGFLFQRNA